MQLTNYEGLLRKKNDKNVPKTMENNGKQRQEQRPIYYSFGIPAAHCAGSSLASNNQVQIRTSPPGKLMNLNPTGRSLVNNTADNPQDQTQDDFFTSDQGNA